ncbi:MAG: hypothetical protein NZ653_08055, partial [Anaerolineae bacterium]|nr:hypothetical protein [Anaerolineae bacterium]
MREKVLWILALILITTLALIPAIWAAPEQSPERQTVPTRTFTPTPAPPPRAPPPAPPPPAVSPAPP